MSETVAVPQFPMQRECPYHPPAGYQSFLDQGPITRVRLFDDRQVWLVIGHAPARTLLTDSRLSSDRRNPDFPLLSPRRAALTQQRALIGMDPPEHNAYRRMLMSSFTHKRINALRPVIQEVVDGRLDSMLAQDPPVDLLSALALPVASIVICKLLGVPYSDHDFFERQSLNLVTATSEEQGTEAVDNLRSYLRKLIEAKQDEPGDGLLDTLIVERVSAGELSIEELVTVSLVLLVAGHETTASSSALGMATLLDNPDQLAALHADPELVPAAVEELLRYLSVADIVSRVATADIEIEGCSIRAGDGVLLSTSAINRDGSVYERPDDLDVHRSPRHHTAFGYGVHQCIGHNLARAELDIIFRSLFARAPTMRMAVTTDQLRVKGPFGPQGVFELPVVW